MNKMKEVAQLLGVELGERFNIEDDLDNPYFITEEGLFDCDSYPDGENLINLLNGKAKIKHLPFKPKYGEKYWTVGKYYSEKKYFVTNVVWTDFTTDITRYKTGLVFRTEEEAEKIGIPRIKEIVQEYNR